MGVCGANKVSIMKQIQEQKKRPKCQTKSFDLIYHKDMSHFYQHICFYFDILHQKTYVCSLMLLSDQAWQMMFDFVQDLLPL